MILSPPDSAPLPSQQGERSTFGIGARLRAELASARSALEVQTLVEAACALWPEVHRVQVVQNASSFLCIITITPGRVVPAGLMTSLGARPFGIDCAMLVIPNRRKDD